MKTIIGELEEPTENKARRKSAKKALVSAKYWGADTYGEDHEDGIVDLMADLLHLAHSRGINLTGVLRKAVGHFEEERFGGWS